MAAQDVVNDETAPLLGVRECETTKKITTTTKSSFFSPATLILIGGFIISISFSYTQTPLLYTFHVMVCEEFYKHAPPYEGIGDRCARNEIDAGAARQIAIMGSATVLCGITNLFIAGWEMRKYGPKKALAIQTFFPAIRVVIQAAALFIGARTGVIVMQLSQLTSIWGGPAGYILILNTIVAEITEQAGRTAMFGKLQGVLMLGTSLGLIVGGTVADQFGIEKPFELACVSFLICTAYVLSFVVYIDPKSLSSDSNGPKGKGIAGIFGPLRILGPQRMRLADGRIVKHHGIVFLALGIFAGVLATGYAPTLIQLYSMAAFGFTSANNSMLISMNFLVRGLFLMFVFPRIISYGRIAFGVRDQSRTDTPPECPPTDSCDAASVSSHESDPEESAKSSNPASGTPGAGFDLFFLRWSLLVDGIITAFSAFATQGWHMYLVGCLLPLASGSAPAAKGVLTEMVPANRKADALQAMTLVEHAATLSTMGLFGFIFSSFAETGRTYMTFYCNAAVALVAVLILLFSRFPPPGSEMVGHQTETED